MKDVKDFINDRIFKSKNITVLLGAGASVGCGLPTGDGLFKDLLPITELEEYNEIQDIIKIEYTKASDSSAISISSKDGEGKIYNIETYLSKIENAEKFYQNQSDTEKKELINKFYQSCIAKMQNKITHYTKNKTHYNLISRLLSTRNDPSKGRLRIFTTNYDTIIEDACANEGIIVIDGFSFVGQDRVFNPSYFDYDVIDSNLTKRNNITERIGNLVYLYKLHGSINWEKIEDQFYSSNRKDIEKPMIIIPGDGKFENSYNSPYLDMIGKFREGLRESELLIIAGYSFSDIHINNIIIEASQRNQNLSILICLKGAEDILECYMEHDKDELGIAKFTDKVFAKIDPIKAIKDKCLALTHKNIFEYFANNLLTNKLVNHFNKFEESRKVKGSKKEEIDIFS